LPLDGRVSHAHFLRSVRTHRSRNFKEEDEEIPTGCGLDLIAAAQQWVDHKILKVSTDYSLIDALFDSFIHSFLSQKMVNEAAATQTTERIHSTMTLHTMTEDNRTKSVHIIPVDEDVEEPLLKRRRIANTQNIQLLSRVEEDGVQGLLALRSSIMPIDTQPTCDRVFSWSLPPAKSDIKPMKSMKPRPYIGKPLSLPPPLPRIPFGCTFSSSKDSTPSIS